MSPTPHEWLLRVAFDGAGFAGFQKQEAGIRTVAGALEDGWHAWTGERPWLRTSSRTDAGVHARRMPVHVRTARALPAKAVVLGFNAHLPEDVAVQEASPVPAGFHVRRDAIGKQYVYRIWTARARNPLRRHDAWHVPWTLDVEAMRVAAGHLRGEHDFSAFRAAGCQAKSTKRYIWRVDVDAEQAPLLEVRVRGNAFLRNMVRIMAGTLAEVGKGRIEPEAMPHILQSRRRDAAGPTAPAHGLTLDDVRYGPPASGAGLDHAALDQAWPD
jgi:tRNA pseudouridine38-40 synthase